MDVIKLASRAALAGALVVSAAGGATAEKAYDTGATDTEIKIGNIVPYSGPASAYGVVGKLLAAYFNMLNDQGGINGRKINFLSYDDAYSPPKAVEQVRKLVESDEVLLIFNALGTPSNSAVQKYLNTKKVPQLFISTGATKWGDPKNFPWTMGWNPSYQSEGRIYAKYLLREKPDAKIGVLYQNDDFGKDYLKGLRDGLGDKISMIVAEEPYELTQPTIESNIVKLKSMGVDAVVSFSTPKFAAQTIKKMGELDWKPVHIVANVSNSVGAVMKPGGFENAQGVISAGWVKDGSDPQWDNDPAMKAYYAMLEKYAPEISRTDIFAVISYSAGLALKKVIEQAGDNLTRENIMKQAASLKDFKNEALLPGILVNTGPDDFFPIEQFQLMRFKGERWELFGSVMDGEASIRK
jgi:branched-chain amino acid transport system substrate-binding protein